MREESAARACEHAITTRFRKPIWRRFIEGVQRYSLIKAGDNIAVCVSGGKDSLLLCKCMQILQRHSDVPFSLRFLAMDPGYTPENRALTERNAALLGIPLTVFESDIFQTVETVATSPCHVCACMRRGHLYKEAQKLGCNKIALGHHFDDVVETILLSLLYGGQFKSMLPALDSRNFPGMRLIRPLFLVREEHIIAWRDALGIQTLACACRVTRKEGGGKRQEIKALLAALEKQNPMVKSNIFGAATHVNLQTILGYRTGEGGEIISQCEGTDDGEEV